MSEIKYAVTRMSHEEVRKMLEEVFSGDFFADLSELPAREYVSMIQPQSLTAIREIDPEEFASLIEKISEGP